MNLEPIDTSTTAGKAEVMRLAAEGRRVAFSVKAAPRWEEVNEAGGLYWNWYTCDFAIISEPDVPKEVWVLVNVLGQCVDVTSKERRFGDSGTCRVVRYVRADQ